MSVRNTPAPMPSKKRPSNRLSISAACVATNRMVVRQVGHRRADFYLRGEASKRREEHQAGRNILDEIRQVLATIAFGVAKFVGKHERVAIFPQRLGLETRRG